MQDLLTTVLEEGNNFDQQTQKDNLETIFSSIEVKLETEKNFEQKNELQDVQLEHSPKIDHREILNSKYGTSENDWEVYGPTEDNIAYKDSDGKHYFTTDTKKEFPLLKSVGDDELFSDGDKQWVMCYEAGFENSIVCHVYSREIPKQKESEIEKNIQVESDQATALENNALVQFNDSSVFSIEPIFEGITFDLSPLLIATEAPAFQITSHFLQNTFFNASEKNIAEESKLHEILPVDNLLAIDPVPPLKKTIPAQTTLEATPYLEITQTIFEGNLEQNYLQDNLKEALLLKDDKEFLDKNIETFDVVTESDDCPKQYAFGFNKSALKWVNSVK